MTTKVTIMNNGASFDVLPIKKAAVKNDKGEIVKPAEYGEKITIAPGATVLDKETAEYVCRVFNTRCSIAGIGVSDDSDKKIAELTKELESKKAELADANKKIEEMSAAAKKSESDLAAAQEKIAELTKELDAATSDNANDKKAQGK